MGLATPKISAKRQNQKRVSDNAKPTLKLLKDTVEAQKPDNIVALKRPAANSSDIAPQPRPKTIDRLSPEAVEARNNLIESNIPLAHKLAFNIMKRWNVKLPREEVQSIANEAICEAAARFDAARGVKFGTYLFFFIKGHLGVAVTESVRASKCSSVSYVPGEAIPTPCEELQLKRSATKMAQTMDSLSEFEKSVADYLVLNDNTKVNSLAEEAGRARESVSRTKTDVRDQLLSAWKAA